MNQGDEVPDRHSSSRMWKGEGTTMVAIRVWNKSKNDQATMLSGSGEDLPRTPSVPAFCAPFDVNCWLGQAAQWIAQNIFNVLQPLVDAVNQSSLNVITQTPAAGTYQNATVMQFTTW